MLLNALPTDPPFLKYKLFLNPHGKTFLCYKAGVEVYPHRRCAPICNPSFSGEHLHGPSTMKFT